MRWLAFVVVAPLAAFCGGNAAIAADRIELAFQVEQESRIERMAQPVRSIIERQMDAVREANAEAAFAGVAPKLKQQFVTGENYLRFFREQFPNVAAGHIIAFGDLRETSYGMAQLVQISDQNGDPWVAFFIMDRENGDWRIANLVVLKVPVVNV